MMGVVFWKFDYSEYSNHKLFRNYKIQKTADPKKLKYTISALNSKFECRIIEEKASESVDKLISITAISEALYASIVNNSLNNVSNTAKDLLKDSYETLTLFLAEDQQKYQKLLQIISSAIQALKPQFQLKVIEILKEHLKESFQSLFYTSNILIENGHHEEAVKLLKYKLSNSTSTEIEAYRCMHNLADAYAELGKFKKAEEWFLNALKGLPNNEDIICSLWCIYRAVNKVEEAEKLFPNLNKNSQDHYSLSLNAYTINKKSLESINKKTLPPNFLDSYKCYEYISKYNNYSDIEKNKNNKKISDEVKKLITSTKLNKLNKLSFVLYLKQNELALDILKEMPKGFFKTFPNLVRLKALLDPNSILSIDEKYTNTDDANNIFNIVCNSLIAEKGHQPSVIKTIETLKETGKLSDEIYNEVKFTTNLLDGNKEQAKEHAVQLSEEKKEEIIENFSSIDEQIDNIDQFVEQFDAKKIHEYYQTKKKHDLLLLKEEITKTPSGYWKLENEEVVTTEKAKFIGKFKGKNCYGIISEKLESKVGSSKFNIFKKTLEEKGLIFKKIAQNGVKFLKKTFEIKIDGDERIYTNEVYENQEEELLLNFDHNGNHDEVKNFLIGCSLEYHKFA
ncbi:MAG: tetratricopeptide repeat protein [Rickettsia endosymbiont of Graphium doson]|nr:tetratricopeptide repeat protein [Rickettsia endosymbiont of Graphium doson]